MALTRRLVGALAALAVVLAPAIASAGVFNDVQAQFDQATSSWLTTAMGYAGAIFSGFIVVEVAWGFTEVVLKTRDIDGLLSSLVMRLVWIGTASYLLAQTPTIVTAAVSDFTTIGASIASTAGTAATTPDDLFAQGWKIANAIWDATNGDNFVAQAAEVVPQAIGAFGAMLGFGLAAAQMLLTKIQIDFVVGAGAILVGFIGSRWTLPYAELYPRMVIQSLMKLVAVILVGGLGAALGPRWVAAAQTTGAGPSDWISLGASAIVYGFIAWNLPSLMQSFAGASPAFGAPGLVSGAADAAGSAGRALGAAFSGGGSEAGKAAGSAVGAIEKAAGR